MTCNNEITEDDKILMNKDFEQWIKDKNIRNNEYYNGNIYFICNDGDLLCENCLTKNKHWIDDLIGYSFLEESHLEQCSHCNKFLIPNYGFICPDCLTVLESDKEYSKECCIKNVEWLKNNNVEF